MQNVFLVAIIICCSLGFATVLKDETITKIIKKKLSAMTKDLRSFTEQLVTENLEIEDNFINTTLTPERNVRRKREAKLNARQKFIMNQILTVYAIGGLEDSLCKNHTNEFKKALRQLQPWAVKMFDSSSKLQSGIIMGNFIEYGSFEQCLQIYKEFEYGDLRGQQCTLKITPDERLLRYVLSYRNISGKEVKAIHPLLSGASLLWSVCVPHSCPPEAILSHFNQSLLSVTEGLNVNISLNKRDCYSAEDEPTVTTAQWLVISLFLLLILVTLIATAIDVTNRNRNSKSQLVDIFSLYGNTKKLLAAKTEKQPLDCLHGIRFFSMCHVVLGHTYVIAVGASFINSFEVLNWVLHYTSTIILGGTVCVDTFFMITGLLVTYNFFHHVSSGKKFHLGLFYLRRYIRVTPSLMVVALVHATLIQHLGSGPLWRNVRDFIQKPCQYFWWSAMLHVQNYVNPKYICVVQTWYMTCDTQFYFLSPLILWPLWKTPILGCILLSLLYILSVSISFYFAWVNKYNGYGLTSNRFLREDYFLFHYITPHTRAPPFLIGVAFGYLLFKTKDLPIKINPFMVFLGWSSSIALLLLAVMGSHAFQMDGHEYNRIESTIFISCTRSAWTVGMVWIVWACTKGYGGPVDYLLSFPTYQILNRLSYVVFLIHLGNQFMMAGSRKVAGYFSDFQFIYLFFGDMVFNLAIALVFALLIESPIAKVESLWLRKVYEQKESVQSVQPVKVYPSEQVNIKENGFLK